MITAEGDVKVLDFGLAKAVLPAATDVTASLHGLTQVGTSVGIPAYLAPEQLAGDSVDQRSDLFALGIVHSGNDGSRKGTKLGPKTWSEPSPARGAYSASTKKRN